MAIDIGSDPIARAYSRTITDTLVDQNNPANAAGTIDTWQIWLDGIGYYVEVATFYVVSGNNLSTRDSEIIGTVSPGSLQTFSGLSTDVAVGDYAGIYGTGGSIERDTADIGYWTAAGDNIPCSNVEFNSTATKAMSLYGTGEEIAPPAEGMPWNLAPRMAMMISSH